MVYLYGGGGPYCHFCSALSLVEMFTFPVDVDVQFNISTMISIEPDLLAAVEDQARRRGVGVETLVNLWLQEKLSEQGIAAAAKR